VKQGLKLGIHDNNEKLAIIRMQKEILEPKKGQNFRNKDKINSIALIVVEHAAPTNQRYRDERRIKTRLSGRAVETS
jgi:hypothetical protein